MAGQKLTGVSGVKMPKLNALNKDPVSRSILSLLTPEGNQKKEPKSPSANAQIPKSTLERISKITSTTIDANRELMEAVPGAFKALSILQSAILSPRNLTTINLTYDSAPYEGRNNDLNNLLLNRVKDYVENNYKITGRLQDILADILFYKGSHAVALLSSSALDNIINGHVKASMEALSDEYKDGEFITRGYLGDNDSTLANGTRRASLESLIAGDAPLMTNDVVADPRYNITVTDNDSVLRLPQLKAALARNAMAKKVRVPVGLRKRAQRGYGIESLDANGVPKNKDGSDSKTSMVKSLSSQQYADIYNELFKQREYQQTDLVEVRRDDELTQENVDAAMWLNLPPESVVPIHMPGNPRARVGAYILLDADCNPLSTAMDENQYQDTMQNSSDTADAIDGVKGIIAMAQEFKEGNSAGKSMVEFRRKIDDDIERDLVQRMANGTFGQKVALGLTAEIKGMMQARALRNLKTKVLFIPEESLVYFAFDFNKYGIGRSLLERSRLYASMAMANVISTTMANISASTNVTTLGIQLDPDNAEPDATVESIVTNHLNGNRSMSSLIGARNPRDVVNIMDEASVLVKTSGHPGYPDIDVDVSYDKRSITPPDPEWNDRLLEILWNMWGVDPALLTTNNATQFAVEHINNNALFRKSTGLQRTMLCDTLSELAQKITFKSGDLMNDLYELIMENKKLWAPTSKKGKEQLKELKEEHPEIENNDESLANFILVNFINSIRLTLPEPLEGDTEDQNRMYDTYRERFDKSIKDCFPDEVLSYMIDGGDTSKFETWRQNLVSHKMREWMAGSGSYADMTALCEVGDDSNAAITLLAGMVNYNEQTLKGIIEYLKMSNKVKGEIKASFDKLEADGHTENNPAAVDYGDGGGQGADVGDGFGGDAGGGDGGAGQDFDENGNPINGGDAAGAGDANGDAGFGDAGDASSTGTEGGEGGEAGDAAAASDVSAMSAAAEPELDANGDPIVESEEPELDANGDPVIKPADEPKLDENGDPIIEPELDEEGNPIVPDPELDEEGNPIVAEPELDEEGNPIDPNAKAETVAAEDFVEENLDDNSDVDFEEENHDDGELEFDNEGKPKGKKRKSKRTQKKEAKKAKDAADGLDFS